MFKHYKHISYFRFKKINADCVFIYKNIDIAVMGMDSESMYIDIIFEVNVEQTVPLFYPLLAKSQ